MAVPPLWAEDCNQRRREESKPNHNLRVKYASSIRAGLCVRGAQHDTACNVPLLRAYRRQMTTHSSHLLALGRRVLEPYTRLDGAACAAITGSSAEGHADEFSDLDMTVYYNHLPPED